MRNLQRSTISYVKEGRTHTLWNVVILDEDQFFLTLKLPKGDVTRLAKSAVLQIQPFDPEAYERHWRKIEQKKATGGWRNG